MPAFASFTILLGRFEVLRPVMLTSTYPPSKRARLLRRLAERGGYTLVELLVVMVILLVILTALTDAFASATKAEVDQTSRASDQQSARQALDRMRKDIHCASSSTGPTATVDGLGNPNGGYVILFNETPGQCYGVTTAPSTGVQWCTVLVTPTRYALYRENTGVCDGANATFEVDYLTVANPWTVPACAAGRYPTVEVDLNVNRDPVTRPGRNYELKDAIALRNALTTCA
jgi:prepilin-type N-terminal cleavage/methylation domain-containing protein